MLTRPRNLSFTLAIKSERNSGGGVNDSAMDQSASSIEASIYRESGGELVGRIMIRGYESTRWRDTLQPALRTYLARLRDGNSIAAQFLRWASMQSSCCEISSILLSNR